MTAFQNNGKLKLLIIVGTRPEIIRLSEVIKKCRTYFDTLLAHTGQNYDYNLNGIFFRDLDLREPEIYMDAVGENASAVDKSDHTGGKFCSTAACFYGPPPRRK